eukprot:m.34392 g.34392  ORF g.34392 m.34392 type:complete len:74 (+) comp11011_c1_seq1:91-312(+)
MYHHVKNDDIYNKDNSTKMSEIEKGGSSITAALRISYSEQPTTVRACVCVYVYVLKGTALFTRQRLKQKHFDT